MKRLILIGGGVGPFAGLELHRLVLQNTDAHKDQDHLRIVHLSCPDMVEDRTDCLLAGHPEKPAEGMAEMLLAGEAVARQLGMPCVAGISCNTFHAGPIWEHFTRQLAAKGFVHPVLNMIEETVACILTRYQHIKNIGVLSTTGTRKIGIYSSPLKKNGLNVLEAREQEKTHAAIYDPQWGIKSNATVPEKARAVLMEQIEELETAGAELVILGCTELPLAVTQENVEIPLIDPMNVLAARLVDMAKNDSKL